MFILIRRDILPLTHCAVQSSHAVAEYMANYGQKVGVVDWMNNHKTMILLSATEEDIANIKRLYDELGLTYTSFIEPDMSNAETATAFEPIANDISKAIFGKLSLLK
jgi:hypothetical protein